MRRALAGLLALLTALPAAALVPLPVALPGVGEATIYRDAYGVPHIFADDAFTLFYANGYAQAQDRLFAMDALRHVGRGEAARVLGPGLLGSDLQVRRDLATDDERVAKFLAMSPSSQEAFEAFALGVNRAMLEMTAQGSLPGEFVALNHVPEPWTPLDTIAVADFLLDHFGNSGGEELANARLLDRLQATLPPDDAEAAFGDVVWGVSDTAYATIRHGTFDGPVALPKPLASLLPEQREALDAARGAVSFGLGDLIPPPITQSALPGFDPQRIKWGSNAVLVAPALSRTHQALVGGGPQTGYFNPEILWEVGLHGGGVDVVGVGVMGAPGVVLGRTPTFAWTVTSGFGDQTDIVALRATGDRSYDWDGASRDLACRQELHVAINPPALGPALPIIARQEVCLSHVGSIVAITLDADGAPAWFFAAHKVHRGREMAGAEQWLSIDAAHDLAQFREAFEGFPFTFNFNYAGAEGACYHHVGSQPLRNLDLDPRFPTPAGEAFAWSGALSGAELPRSCDPAGGYFANWNNLPERGFPSGDARESWGSLHRVQLLDQAVRRAIDASRDHLLDLPELRGALRDAATHDPFAGALIPYLLEGAPQGAQHDLAAWAAEGAPWADADADGTYDDAGMAWYDAMRPQLQERVLGDELGPLMRSWNPNPMTSGDPHAADHGTADTRDALMLDALSGHASHDWCDDVATPAHETCNDVVALAFADAGAPEPLAVYRSPFTPIGAGPAYTMPMTNRATYFHFHVGTDITRSGSALPPGESGHLSVLDLADVVLNGGQGPEHMRDQLPLYNAFELKPVPVTRAQAESLAAETQVLLVAGAPLPV
ncbi:MAG TPA: penicillin acylase family protein [Candidatus Thermoplasmatota archaeon]|jgi:acyl-homoserine lactone acylase PvdQ|nr:penicillin acylase family protein [Candidatus Thermoplasmatota archaeon]